MTTQFKDKVAIITGGASGIGKSLAEQLSMLGAKIIIVDYTERPHDFDGEYYQTDMANEEAVKKLFDLVVQKHTQIDYVFNNAGIFMAGEIRDTPIENWRKVVENNIWAVNNGTHYAYQHMLKQGSGHIINVASAAGLFPVPAMGIYGSSKFAIVGMSHALRSEAKSLGIRVSVVCPTIVNTPLSDTATYNRLDKEKALEHRESLQAPDVTAQKIIKGIMKNKATIHTAVSTKLAWKLYGFSPSLYGFFAEKAHKKYRQALRLEK